MDLIDYFSKIDTSCKSYNYLCTRIAATCTDYFAALLTLPISKESLIQIKEFDKFIKIKSSPLYERMANLERKASKTIHMIRKSNYSLYWIFALLRKLI